jgi:surfactin synthase thioesterase subunit
MLASKDQGSPQSGSFTVMPSRSSPRSKWLLREPSPSAEARLFCFPYAGAGATMYDRWPRVIGDAEVCPLQPPARQNRIREPHYLTYETLAEELIGQIGEHLDRPFAIFGHCSGALPGVEVTRALQRTGALLPARLFVSAQVAPQDGPFGRMLALDRAELREELASIVTAQGGTPSEVLLDLGVGLLEADLEANRRYVVAEPPSLDCPVTAIGWRWDDVVPASRMDGWSSVSSTVRHVVLDGSHFDFLDGPESLIEELAADLRFGGPGQPTITDLGPREDQP